MQVAAGADGQVWIVEPIESGQNWGAASTQLVHALMDNHAVAIIALDRDSSHLAAQLSLKSFVPVLALSDDRTLTPANVPWVFRLPAATTPATALDLLRQAAARVGPDGWKLRDLLASGAPVAGLAFEHTGELRP
jgi:hypothetical protein